MRNIFKKTLRLLFKKSVPKAILSLAVLSVGHSVGQEPTNAEIQERRQAFAASTKTLSSYSGIYELPAYVLYSTIFRHVLIDPNLSVRFPRSDLAIIRQLPSHSHAVFTDHARDRLAEACSKIETVRGYDSRSAQSMAEHFEAAKTQIRDQLNDHYDAVLLALSDRGREIVQSEIVKLSYSNAISSTDLDLTILSRESPDSAAIFINQSCANVALAPMLNEPRALTMWEEMEESIYNGSATFAPSSTQ